MTHALILNALILLVIGIALYLTSNPLVLMCLLLLKELPFGLMVNDDDDEDPGEDESKPMGFIHNE
jgi:hypothetical protein